MIRPPALACLAFALAGCQLQDWSWEGSPGTQTLAEYKESYYRELGTQFTDALSWSELLAEVRRTRVLFIGDHHRDPDLHRRTLELIYRLSLAGMQPVLGLESVGQQDLGLVTEFLDGSWNMAELRIAMLQRWSGSWLDDPEVDRIFYRDLLTAARDLCWPVFALEPTPRLPLLRRDEVMARNIRAAAERHDERVILVIVGQAHLLGHGGLIRRVDLPHVAIGANLSSELVAKRASAPVGEFLRSSSGVLFFQDSSIETP